MQFAIGITAKRRVEFEAMHGRPDGSPENAYWNVAPGIIYSIAHRPGEFSLAKRSASTSQNTNFVYNLNLTLFLETPMARVPASEFQREFGRLRGVAHREAVIVTSHGRDDVVLVSAEEYQRLRGLDRRAMHVSELSDEDLAALDAVEIPAEAARYNHEMT
jgi:prevent-host-death family protein